MFTPNPVPSLNFDPALPSSFNRAAAAPTAVPLDRVDRWPFMVTPVALGALPRSSHFAAGS